MKERIIKKCFAVHQLANRKSKCWCRFFFKGDFVFGAKANDDDDGENSRIVYQLHGKDANRFTIDLNNGVIRATQELIDDQTTYQLQILASDCGVEPQHVTADLVIHLWERQLFPSFRSSVTTRFTLSEDVSESKVITKLSATTPKSGPASNLIYGIAGGNVGDALRIDPHTGEVNEIRHFNFTYLILCLLLFIWNLKTILKMIFISF